MKIIVFDTETTGFIDKKNPDLTAQPYIIQFAGIAGKITQDGKFKELERKNIFIKPPIPIPYAASQVHHIYDIDVQSAPNISEAINEIMEFLMSADAIVGHNIEYDEEMLKLELKRLGRLHEYIPNQVLCSMKSSVDFCALQGNGERFKYPKLWELYKKLFGEYFIGAHDAMVDVEATLKCVLELDKRGILPLEKKENQLMSLF